MQLAWVYASEHHVYSRLIPEVICSFSASFNAHILMRSYVRKPTRQCCKLSNVPGTVTVATCSYIPIVNYFVYLPHAATAASITGSKTVHKLLIISLLLSSNIFQTLIRIPSIIVQSRPLPILRRTRMLVPRPSLLARINYAFDLWTPWRKKLRREGLVNCITWMMSQIERR